MIIDHKRFEEAKVGRMTVEKTAYLTTVWLKLTFLMVFGGPYKTEDYSLRFCLILSFSMAIE